MTERSAPVIITLVHHAEAVGPEVDPERPLSRLGRAQAEWLARESRIAGIKPVAIQHSGKVRARQTAEYFWRACNPQADFRMVRGLRPDDGPSIMRDVLLLEEGETLVVSHMPLLPALARALAPEIEGFPLNGLIVLERAADGRCRERLRIRPPGDLPG